MSRLQTILMSVLLSLVLLNYGALAYYGDVLSTRDYSAIPDPHDRVGYCMLSSMTLPDTYLLAQTAAQPPSFAVYKSVMSLPEVAKQRPEVRTALGALKAREKLRERAHGISHLVAYRCGFWKVKWPDGVGPLEVNLKWHRFDSTFWYFLSRIQAEPDAVEVLYKALHSKPLLLVSLDRPVVGN
jgi:hypothetical protein